jgi:ABC-type uncharacterized transport system involved in gliding motility auxiliary subunit
VTPVRAARQWAQLALHVVLLLVGLGLLQLAAERTNRRVDLTPTRDLSLSSPTEQVLAELAGPLHITAFYRRGTREPRAALLDRMRHASAHVDYELLDLDRHPERARALGITQYDRAALEYDGRRAVVPEIAEEPLVGGILHVLRGRTRRVVFTTGHGERAPGGGAESYGRVVAALGDEDLRAEGGVLSAGALPDDTALVVVAGPRHDFLPVEVDRLAAYLKRGGGVVFLLEPGPLPNLAGLLASMGIRLGDDFIVDHERSVIGTDGLAAVVELFKRGNPISEPDGHTIDTGAVLPSARSVDVTEPVPGVDAESIARTAPTAWAMSDADRARRGEEPSKAAADVPGGASVMAMAEVGAAGDGQRRGRAVVVGDADFASDAYIDLLGNRDLVLNAVAWATEDTALAGARTQPVPEVFRPLSPLVLTEQEARALLVGVTIAEPGLVLLAGAVLVGLRRRRG